MDKGARFVYGLLGENSHGVGKEMWSIQDSNLPPFDCQSNALAR